MLKRYTICRNCRHWRQGVPSDMRQPALEDITSDVGACEIGPASMFEMDGEWVAFQPIVHFSRSCAVFEPPIPRGGDDYDGDPADPDPDDGEPQPVPSRVRNLFPIQPAPIAA